MFKVLFDPIFKIQYKNRQILAYYNHWIYSFQIGEQTKDKNHYSLEGEIITLDNLHECEKQNDYLVSRLQKYLVEQKEYVQGFLFRDKNKEVVGFIWVMYAGGNEFQYRVRRTKAFIYDVCVFESYRGKGICGKMFEVLFEYLKSQKGIDQVSLAVRKNNHRALKAYNKIGGHISCSRRFIQLARKYNIPYYSV